MKKLENHLLRALGLSAVLGVCIAVCGCKTTPKVDWQSRVGSYTYDQAVLELGPPDRYAKLTDDTVVAEWVTRRGTTQVWVNYTYGYGYWWMHPGYVTTSAPERLLRLTFGPDGRLKAWKKLYR